MSQSVITHVLPTIRHLDGCADGAALIPCFTQPGGACHTTHVLGTVADVCDETASVYAVRSVDQDGTDAYLNVAALSYGQDLSMTPEQARRLAALLIAGAALIDLNRDNDATVFASWSSR
jgi:hypothetical protein